MTDHAESKGTAPIVDHRQAPRGVLPRGVQTWLMVALAIVMLFIIVLTGRPAGPAPRTATATAAPASADRVKEYQDRLRQLDEQMAREVREAAQASAVPTPVDARQVSPPTVDPAVAERRRREVESLFASNVVFSRRPENQQPDAAHRSVGSATNRQSVAEPSIDDIADAVVRASVKTAGAVAQSEVPRQERQASTTDRNDGASAKRVNTSDAGRISSLGPTHRLLEGTVIDTVLANRLDGGTAAPVNCLVTNAVYSHSGQQVLIPPGARVLGETKPVQSFGETRLAVSFYRLLFPDGSSVLIDQFKGLNQIGETGLRDRVNQHYWSTFGAAGAVGLVSGLAQLLGSAGFGSGEGNRTVVVSGSAADATAQATAQVMNRFLNRLPTITIREGHRVKVYITSDLDLPEWVPLSTAVLSERRSR